MMGTIGISPKMKKGKSARSPGSTLITPTRSPESSSTPLPIEHRQSMVRLLPSGPGPVSMAKSWRYNPPVALHAPPIPKDEVSSSESGSLAG